MAGPALSDKKPVLGTNVGAITLVDLSDDSGRSDEKHYDNVNDDAASVLIPKTQLKRTWIPEHFGDNDIFASHEDKKPKLSVSKFEHQKPLVATPSPQHSIGAGCLEDFEKADLPLGFLEPLSPDVESGCIEDDFATSTPNPGIQAAAAAAAAAAAPGIQQNCETHSCSIHDSSLKQDCRQFWKAGDYENEPTESRILDCYGKLQNSCLTADVSWGVWPHISLASVDACSFSGCCGSLSTSSDGCFFFNFAQPM